jgi:hypothetical protein
LANASKPRRPEAQAEAPHAFHGIEQPLGDVVAFAAPGVVGPLLFVPMFFVPFVVPHPFPSPPGSRGGAKDPDQSVYAALWEPLAATTAGRSSARRH